MAAPRNRLREARRARGWSQEELARRAGTSRASVSAIETGRLVPAITTGLALAACLGCRVEVLFPLEAPAPSWCGPPPQRPTRCWVAQVGTRRVLYPLGAGAPGGPLHDAVVAPQGVSPAPAGLPSLVVATCDPAAGLLAAPLARRHGLRLLVLQQSSRAALDLLRDGLVHAAGLHLAGRGASGNAGAAREVLGPCARLLRVCSWREGLALRPGLRLDPETASRARLRWVGREAGSGARQCLDHLLAGRRAPRRRARDHRGVVEALRCGWADAGVALELPVQEAGLEFVPVREEAYELCLAPGGLEDDGATRALVDTVRSNAFRELLADLPGYSLHGTGELRSAGGEDSG